MRALAVCASSFVLALIVGMFIVPDRVPVYKPSPGPPKIQTPQTTSPEMLPTLPSLRPARKVVPSNQYGRRAEAGATMTVRNAPQRPAAARHRPVPAPQRSPRTTPAAPASQGPPTVLAPVHGAAAATFPRHASRHQEPAAAPPAPPAAVGLPEDTKISVSPGASPSVRRPEPVTRRVSSSAPTAPAEATPAPPSGRAGRDAYLLRPGDQIEVTVPHLAVTVTIDPDGVIALPMISPVKAAGKTPVQLASDLTSMYSRVLQAPSVTVFVRHRLNH